MDTPATAFEQVFNAIYNPAMIATIRITQDPVTHDFYAVVEYGDGHASKRHGPFHDEKHAAVYLRKIYKLPKVTAIVTEGNFEL